MLKKQNYHYLRIIYPRTIILFLNFLLFFMKQIASPIFQSFPILLYQNQIDGWTSNKIWNELNLSEEEKQRINQQQLYRLLRKLVKQGHLIKNINSNNSRLSTFFETESMSTIRKQFELETVKNDSEKPLYTTNFI